MSFNRPKFQHCLIYLMCLLLPACAANKHVNNRPDRNDSFVTEYSAKLGVSLDKSCNRVLIKVVSEWIGTPYKYGGQSKDGTDCSGFILNVYKEVYGIGTERSANSIYEQSSRISKSALKEGDLVFFKINTTKVGHVGIYIKDGFFVHASTKKGVTVNNLEEAYYTKYFFAAGRIK